MGSWEELKCTGTDVVSVGVLRQNASQRVTCSKFQVCTERSTLGAVVVQNRLGLHSQHIDADQQCAAVVTLQVMASFRADVELDTSLEHSWSQRNCVGKAANFSFVSHLAVFQVSTLNNFWKYVHRCKG